MSHSKAPGCDFHWEGYQLCLGKKKLPYRLLRHVSWSAMYYCCTPYGNSEDFYNITRAKEHLMYLYRIDHAFDI